MKTKLNTKFDKCRTKAILRPVIKRKQLLTKRWLQHTKKIAAIKESQYQPDELESDSQKNDPDSDQKSDNLDDSENSGVVSDDQQDDIDSQSDNDASVKSETEMQTEDSENSEAESDSESELDQDSDLAANSTNIQISNSADNIGTKKLRQPEQHELENVQDKDSAKTQILMNAKSWESKAVINRKIFLANLKTLGMKTDLHRDLSSGRFRPRDDIEYAALLKRYLEIRSLCYHYRSQGGANEVNGVTKTKSILSSVKLFKDVIFYDMNDEENKWNSKESDRKRSKKDKKEEAIAEAADRRENANKTSDVEEDLYLNTNQAYDDINDDLKTSDYDSHDTKPATATGSTEKNDTTSNIDIVTNTTTDGLNIDNKESDNVKNLKNYNSRKAQRSREFLAKRDEEFVKEMIMKTKLQGNCFLRKNQCPDESEIKVQELQPVPNTAFLNSIKLRAATSVIPQPNNGLPGTIQNLLRNSNFRRYFRIDQIQGEISIKNATRGEKYQKWPQFPQISGNEKKRRTAGLKKLKNNNIPGQGLSSNFRSIPNPFGGSDLVVKGGKKGNGKTGVNRIKGKGKNNKNSGDQKQRMSNAQFELRTLIYSR